MSLKELIDLPQERRDKTDRPCPENSGGYRGVAPGTQNPFPRSSSVRNLRVSVVPAQSPSVDVVSHSAPLVVVSLGAVEF